MGAQRSGRAAVAVPVAVLAAAVLTACGGDPRVAAPGGTAAPATARPTDPAPAPTSAPGAPTPGTVIPGEDLDPAELAELQRAVDAGSQPWRLDVREVAAAFARARLGWPDPSVALADPHTAEITDPASGRIVVLQLRTPGSEAPGTVWFVESGVWVV